MREIAICFVVILGLTLPASIGQGRATAKDIPKLAIFRLTEYLVQPMLPLR